MSLPGQQIHLSTHEVIGNRHAPELLANLLRRLGTNSFFSLQRMRLEFIVSEFQFPAFMIKLHNLRGRVGLGIDQRSQKNLAAESFSAIADRACLKGSRPVRMRFSDSMRETDFDQGILPAQTFDQAPSDILFCSQQPMPISSGL